MDNDSKKQIEYNFGIIPSKTKKAFVFLSKQKWLGEGGWYLAGGTALSLQVGNRKSVDLDFFTMEKKFNSEKLLSNFLGSKEWKLSFGEDDNTIYGELFKAKISFIAYPFFIPKQDFIKYGSIRILQPRDIAVMKIIAISQRGRKRDFFDLYWCVKKVEPLEDLIKRLKEQYPFIIHDYHYILKSLVYFDDAEADPEPEIVFRADWIEVKNYFRKEVLKITDNIILKS